MLKHNPGAAMLGAAIIVCIATGCSGAPATPAVTPAAPAATEAAASADATTPAPTPEPTAEPTVGTRAAPLAVGESRKISEGSAFNVSVVDTDYDAFQAIRGADEWHEEPSAGMTFITATVSIGIDEPALQAQGIDIATEGAMPGLAVTVEYVGASGQSYGASGTEYCYTTNDLATLDPIYDASVLTTGNSCIVIPEADVAGGMWRVSNMQNDAVWVEGA